ncbi:MAG: YdgA family protein [Alysiella sp.]|uniref:YdgA family protein n=1 Tax=Alysiella sp. TaxID=1872483 RepID=UPI0026DAE01C|nr:YdgA family protein [Alysiella sp.]MDO4433225.1 YdgA family protein [Alysiella sp.]
MKKILTAVATLAILSLVFGFTPYYMGGKAQQSLAIQHRALADTFFFDVVSHEYQRGWFSSTETTVMRFHPAMLSKLNGQLPDNVKKLFDQPVTMVNHVQHGLFADGIKPVRAVVETEFQYAPEVAKTLARFFGQSTPATARNVIALDGSGELTVQVAPFDYEELSGIKINWKGMSAQVTYQEGFTEYRSQFNLPGIQVQLADMGSISLDNLNLTAQSQEGKHDMTLGWSETKLAGLKLAWKQGIDYNVRLNDLVNMVTDLQIGAFINPSGTIAPNDVNVSNLIYRTETQQDEQGFINSRGAFAFEKLQYGQEQYGPLAIDIAAEHLDSKSLTALKQRWAQIATTHQNKNNGDVNDLVLDAVRKEGAGIFTHNPVFKIHQFAFQTPDGHINATGELKFKDLQQADLNDFAAIVRKTQADIGFDVSQNLLENFAVTQARSLFTVEDPSSAQEQQEISDTIRMLVGETIKTMNAEGYIKRENGTVQTRLSLKDNRVTLNDKLFEAPNDQDAFVALEGQSASDAMLPESASSALKY